MSARPHEAVRSRLLSLLDGVAVSDNVKAARMLSDANPAVDVATVQENP
jgi:hypothetical protein